MNFHVLQKNEQPLQQYIPHEFFPHPPRRLTSKHDSLSSTEAFYKRIGCVSRSWSRIVSLQIIELGAEPIGNLHWSGPENTEDFYKDNLTFIQEIHEKRLFSTSFPKIPISCHNLKTIKCYTISRNIMTPIESKRCGYSIGSIFDRRHRSS